MRPREKAIIILTDAEKAFRQEPDFTYKIYNRTGLCSFIEMHELVPYDSAIWYQRYILKGLSIDIYAFGNCSEGQEDTWNIPERRYLRADWCKQQLLERFGVRV